MTQTTPPGWYHGAGDPPGTKRYWDGTAWQGEPQSDTGSLTAPAGAAGAPAFSSSNQLAGPDRLASVARRIFARFIDIIVFTIPAVIFFATAIDWGAFGDAFERFGDSMDAATTTAAETAANNQLQDDINDIIESGFGGGSVVTAIILGLVVWAIEAAMVKMLGATPGKLLLGTRVVDENTNSNLSWMKAILRTGIRALGLLGAAGTALGSLSVGLTSLIGLASLIMLFAQSQNKTVMDMVAGSNVVNKKWLDGYAANPSMTPTAPSV